MFFSIKHGLGVLAVVVFSIVGALSPTRGCALEPEPAASVAGTIGQSVVSEVLLGKSSVLEKVFGTIPTEHEAVSLPDGDIVVLVHGGSHPEIVLFRITQDGQLVWDEEVASIRTEGYKLRPRVIAGKEGGCFVLWTQPRPNGLFVRHLSDKGAELWTTRVTEEDVRSYDVVSASAGALVIATSSSKSVKAFRVELDGTLGWNEQVVTLSSESSAHNPVSLTATKSQRDAVAVWYGASGSAPSSNAFVAQRFRLSDGKSHWAQPTVLGPAPDFALVMPRKVDVRAINDSVEALLYRGEAGDARFDVLEYTVRLAVDGSAVVLEEEQRDAGER